MRQYCDKSNQVIKYLELCTNNYTKSTFCIIFVCVIIFYDLNVIIARVLIDHNSSSYKRFHRVNFPAKIAQFGGTGYVRLAGPAHHPKYLAVAIHDTWDYAKHVPRGFIGLTFQLS